MSKEFPSEAALIADLKATFPGLPVRPLREFGNKHYRHGVWTGAGSGCAFSDGEPLFISWHADGYDGGVHEGFSAWLESRGWYVENYDGATLFIVPILQAQMA